MLFFLKRIFDKGDKMIQKIASLYKISNLAYDSLEPSNCMEIIAKIDSRLLSTSFYNEDDFINNYATNIHTSSRFQQHSFYYIDNNVNKLISYLAFIKNGCIHYTTLSTRIEFYHFFFYIDKINNLLVHIQLYQYNWVQYLAADFVNNLIHYSYNFDGNNIQQWSKLKNLFHIFFNFEYETKLQLILPYFNYSLLA